MAAPAILAFFAAINIREHYKTSSENFKFYLPFFISMMLVFLAEETWEIEEQFLHQNPFPSIADGLYLAIYPFFILFLLRSLNPIRKLLSKKVIVFGGVLSITLLIPTIMSTYGFNSEEELLPFLLLLSYPVLDAIMFGISVVGLLFAFSKSVNYYWILILVGVVLWVFADTGFLYAEITDTYYDGHPVNSLYIISYILWTFAVIHNTKNARKQKSTHEPTFNDPSNKITFSSINKFAVPLSWMITVFVSIYVMFLLNLFEFSQGINEKIALVGLFFGMIIALSSIILLVNKNLSKLVKLRERELEETNAEMRKIEKLSAIGQVTARFAHDMRNPLTAIKNSISLITYKQKLNEKINDAELENINRAVFRMTHQTDDILDFLRDSKVVKSPNSIKKIISYSLSYILQNPDVTINLPKNDAVINCNSYQIERVFVNLILNSMQAVSNNGTISIRIIEEKDFVRIEFEDTGPGIPEQNIVKLFEPLFTTKQVGTGLGLTSCKKIVNNHGGEISFRNDPTTFTVTLPK